MATYKLISCNIFQRELCAAIALSPNIVDPEFLEVGLHENSADLKRRLQERADEASNGAYDAVLLGYGLCGNGLAGLTARGLPLVIARAHDCCTMLLGSRAAFLEAFGESLSASWSSAGYIERSTGIFRHAEPILSSGEYAELAAKYGEENARYVYDTLHPPIEEKELRFIETPETAHLGFERAMRAKAEEEGKEFRLLRGSSRLLRALVAGSWDPEEFLVVPLGASIAPLYDHERVFEAR